MKLKLFLFALLFPLMLNSQYNTPQILAIPAEPRHFADVDMDGDMDFLDELNRSWAERNAEGNYFQNWPICYDQILGFEDVDNDNDQDAYGFVISSGLFGWFENENTHELWSFHAVSDFAYSVPFDLNMDGLIDFTSVTESDQDNAFYNLGDGNFSTAQPLLYPIMNGLLNGGPFYGDFDNDGFQDIVKTACPNTSNGCLDGHYLEYYLSSANYALNGTSFMTTDLRAVGDLNGDGMDDLVTMNFTDNALYIMDDAVVSGFENEMPLCCVETNSDLQFADLNLDGALDLIATDINYEILIYMNDGSGSFSEPPVSFAPGMQLQQASILTFSDVDGDNDLDAFYSDKYFENTGNGQFNFIHNLSTPGGNNWFFSDVDQDGVTEWIGGGENIAHFDPQSGFSSVDYEAFSAGSSYDWTNSWHTIMSDINHNGAMDFIDFKNDAVYAFEYNGSEFILASSSPISTLSYNLAYAISDQHDFNGDGVNDYVFLDGNSGYVVYVIYILEDLQVSGPEVLGTFSNYTSGANVIDIELDGDLDIISSNDYSNYLQNDGDNQFNEAQYPNPNLPFFIDTSAPDLNGDGILDGFTYPTLSEGNGYGLPMINHTFDYELVGQIYWVDYNQDGLPDMINHYCSGNSTPFQNTLRVFVNQGYFDFEEVLEQTFETPLFLRFNSVFNMDNDGDPDLLWWAYENEDSFYYKGLYWSENIGDPLGMISGHVFYDENEDGIWTVDETGIEMTQVTITPDGSHQFVEDVFLRHSGNGTYTIEVDYDEDIWTPTTPTTYTVTIDDLHIGFDQLNFGFIPATNNAAIEVSVIAYPTVCNGVQQYVIQVHNYTELNADVLVTFDFDPHLVYSYSSSIEYSWLDNQIQWMISDMPYGTSQQIHAFFTYPDASLIGAELVSDINACLVDEGLNPIVCDQESWNEIMSCAYDPNEKAVTPVGYTSMGFISNGTELEYTVRFQNTGNAPAHDIVIEDQLNASLDWTTLIPVAWSHPMQAEVSTSGIARFSFQDIMLPDSTSDEQNSHGFVRFKISPHQNLAPSTIISNVAAIYFDLNEPVMTNEVQNTIFSCEMIGSVAPVQYECGLNSVQFDPEIQFVDSYSWLVDGQSFGNENILTVPFNSATSVNVQLTAVNPLCEVEFNFTLQLANEIANLNITQLGNILECTYNPLWTYQWTFGDQPIDGATSSSLDITQIGDGAYNVLVGNNAGCEANAGGFFTVGVLNNSADPTIAMYPVPAKDIVYLNSAQLLLSDISILDMNGKVIQITKMNTHAGELNVSHLSNGIYLLRIRAATGDIFYRRLNVQP